MTTKLTKAFAEFVGERGFEIANEGEIHQEPDEDYKDYQWWLGWTEEDGWEVVSWGY